MLTSLHWTHLIAILNLQHILDAMVVKKENKLSKAYVSQIFIAELSKISVETFRKLVQTIPRPLQVLMNAKDMHSKFWLYLFIFNISQFSFISANEQIFFCNVPFINNCYIYLFLYYFIKLFIKYVHLFYNMFYFFFPLQRLLFLFNPNKCEIARSTNTLITHCISGVAFCDMFLYHQSCRLYIRVLT